MNIQEIISNQGWNDSTVSELALRFIEKNQMQNDFVAFLNELSEVENSENEIVIEAQVHSDDYMYDFEFDALSWFQKATADEIVALANIDWGGDYEADVVATNSPRNVQLDRMFDYIERSREIGFECHVDKKSAMVWLKENRPDVYNKIKEEWIVTHAPTGETVKAGFQSEWEAFNWIKNACESDKVEPPILNEYITEQL